MRIKINQRLLTINLTYNLGNILLSSFLLSESKNNITNKNKELYHVPIESLIKNYEFFELNLDDLLQFRIFENNFNKNSLIFFYNGVGSLVIPKLFFCFNLVNSFKILFESKVLENNIDDKKLKDNVGKFRGYFYYLDVPVLQTFFFIGGIASLQILI